MQFKLLRIFLHLWKKCMPNFKIPVNITVQLDLVVDAKSKKEALVKVAAELEKEQALLQDQNQDIEIKSCEIKGFRPAQFQLFDKTR